MTLEEHLINTLHYDPETGVIRWKVDYNNCKKGQPVFVRKNHGYLIICIKNKYLRVHRVAFLLMTGSWPQDAVDHINGDKSDNRFCNLRQVTNAQNLQNSKLSKKNISGFKGVSWYKRGQKWQSSICANSKRYFLGYFDNIEDAVNARRKAEEGLHGEFASHKGQLIDK
jgi:hypothetical protein